MLQSSNSVLSASSILCGPSLNALAGFTSVIMSAEVRELTELVLVREEEFRYAEWKLTDARKRLKVAQDHEAATAERTKAEAQAAATAKAASPTPDVKKEPQTEEPSPSNRPEQQRDNATKPEQEQRGHAKLPEHEQRDHAAADHPKEAAPGDIKPGDIKYEEMQPPTSPQEHHDKRDQHNDKKRREPASSEEDQPPAEHGHGRFTWSVRPEPEPKNLDAGRLFDKFMRPPSTSATSESGARASDESKAPRFTAQSLVNAAMRADARQDSGYGMADTPESHGLLPPPPPPPPERVQTMCPTPCDCGKPCTRIERMLRQQQACAYARTRLKHNNHTCDECQESWYAAARGPRRPR